jgi:hypothetical protein
MPKGKSRSTPLHKALYRVDDCSTAHGPSFAIVASEVNLAASRAQNGVPIDNFKRWKSDERFAKINRQRRFPFLGMSR